MSDRPKPTTAAELVLRRRDDDSRGLVFEGREWTWREVIAESSARAAWLQSQFEGVEGPFHVGVLLENTSDYLFLIAGAALGGATVVGINPTRRGAELAHDIRHTDCQLIITDDERLPMLRELDLGLPADRVVSAEDPATIETIAAFLGTPPPTTLPTPDDLFLLIFTSGSTGAPKAVRMTQHRAARTAGRVPFSPDDILYSAMPLFHGNALAASVFPAFSTGATLVLRRRFSASSFLPDVREHQATFFNTVGRAIAHIVATPPTPLDRDHQLKYVLGPETSESDKAAFTQRFGVPLFEGYGSSENAIILVPASGARRGSLGVARGDDDVAVVDPETGTELPRARFDDDGGLLNGDEAIGELVGRNTRSNFEGYYNNPEAEAERTRNGWYWSGDLAYRDDDGVFYFAGRSGDWLRVDSENFAAAPVERVLSRYPAARGVAVYAVPDASTGDQVMAAIELDPSESETSQQDRPEFDPVGFAAFLAEQSDLGTKWAPRYVRIIDQLPVTATDKLDRRPLRATRWETPDPLWFRPARTDSYVPFTEDDRAALLAEFEANGRTNLFG